LDGSYGLNTSHDVVDGEPTYETMSFLGSDADLIVTLPTRTRVKVYLLAAPRLAIIVTGGYVVARRMNRGSAPYR